MTCCCCCMLVASCTMVWCLLSCWATAVVLRRATLVVLPTSMPLALSSCICCLEAVTLCGLLILLSSFCMVATGRLWRWPSCSTHGMGTTHVALPLTECWKAGRGVPATSSSAQGSKQQAAGMCQCGLEHKVWSGVAWQWPHKSAAMCCCAVVCCLCVGSHGNQGSGIGDDTTAPCLC